MIAFGADEPDHPSWRDPAVAHPRAPRIVVSPLGDDASAGDEAHPIRTLEEARRRVRALASTHGAVVELTDGTWQLRDPWRLDGSDSGRPGAPIVWTARPGARPVLSGGQVVTGWRPHDVERDVYTVVAPRTRQLYGRDGALPRASVPLDRDGIEITAEGLRVTGAAFDVVELAAGSAYLEIGCQGSFTHRYSPVAAVEPGLLRMTQPAWANNNWGYDTLGQPFDGGALRLWNVFGALQPGQWCLVHEGDEDRLAYRAHPGQHPDTLELVAPLRESLVHIGGTLDEPVHDVVISGLQFSHTTWLRPGTEIGYASQQTGTYLDRASSPPAEVWENCQRGCPQFEATRGEWAQVPAAVQVSAALRVDLVGNSFTRLGQVGLGIGNDAGAHAEGTGLAASDIVVRGNEFTELAGGAIVVGGVREEAHHPRDPRSTVRDVVIDDNLVRGVATDYTEMAGILATYVDGVVIVHNEVCDLAYDGIDVGFGWGANDPGGSPDYEQRGLYRFQPVYDTPTTLRRTLIARNLVHHTKRAFHDGGAIYLLSAQPGAVVRENHIRDNGSSVGLYLDEGSRYVRLEANVVRNAPVWVFTNTYGQNNTSDNTFAHNWYDGGRTHMPDPEGHENRLEGNVLVTADDWPAPARTVMARAGRRPTAG